MGAAAQDGGELGFEELGVAQQHADAAQAEGGVWVGGDGDDAFDLQGLDVFFAAPVEHADGDGVAGHGFDDGAVDVVLGGLVGQGFAVHEEEFAAQEADAGGPGLGDEGEFGGDFEVGLEVDFLAVLGDGGEAAELGQALLFAGEGDDGAAGGGQGGGAGVDDDGAGGAVDDDQVAGAGGFGQAGDAEDGGNAEGAQHDGGVAVGAAFVGGHTCEAGGIEEGCVGGAEEFGDQDGAGGQGGEAAERGAGEVADQAAADFADFLGAAFAAGAVVVGGHRLYQLGDRLAFVEHGGLGADQALGDAFFGAADEAGGADHLEVGVDQGSDLGLAVFGQDAEAGAQLEELLARLGDGGFEAGGFGAAVRGVDAGADHHGGRLDGAEDRADGHAGGNGDAGKAALGPGGFGRFGRGGARGVEAGGLGWWVSPVHGSRPRPGRSARPSPPWRPSPRRAG